MNFDTYCALAKRTEKLMPDLHQRLTHHALGYATEAGEILDVFKKHHIYGKPLDRVNLVEEIGDACWYLAGLANAWQVDSCALSSAVVSGWLIKHNDAAWTLDMLTLQQSFGAISAELAMTVRNSQDAPVLPQRAAYLIEKAFIPLNHLLHYWCVGVTMKEAMAVNVAKLAARYGDKYSDAGATVRDLGTERGLLADLLRKHYG